MMRRKLITNKIFGLAIAVLLVFFASVTFPYWTKDTTTVTVTGKERVYAEGSSKYLIFSEEETFENTDVIQYFKWNSSDYYGKVVVGNTYKFTVYGWRVPFLSWYRNIIKIDHLPVVGEGEI